jgi:hypothetical protein
MFTLYDLVSFVIMEPNLFAFRDLGQVKNMIADSTRQYVALQMPCVVVDLCELVAKTQRPHTPNMNSYREVFASEAHRNHSERMCFDSCVSRFRRNIEQSRNVGTRTLRLVGEGLKYRRCYLHSNLPAVYARSRRSDSSFLFTASSVLAAGFGDEIPALKCWATIIRSASRDSHYSPFVKIL